MSHPEPRFTFSGPAKLRIYKGDPQPADPSWADVEPITVRAFYRAGKLLEHTEHPNADRVLVFEDGEIIYDGPIPGGGP